jgi:RimJ/RimL family protein N-acetyltransferase
MDTKATVDQPKRTVLETSRLRLRELVPEDLGFMAEMLADAEVMRYYPKRLTREL